MFEDTFSRDAAQLSLFVRFLLVFDYVFSFRTSLWPSAGKELTSLLVFDYVFSFRITLWPSAGKELTSWLFDYGLLLYLLYRWCFFPVLRLGQDVEFNCIGSCVLSFHLLCPRILH